MSIFSSSMLLSENYTEPTKVETISTNHSLLEESYRFLTELNNEMMNAKKAYSKSVLEADTTFALNESFGGFVERAKEIINKFLEFIKKIFKKFVIMINKIIKSDKYIRNHKDDIHKFQGTFSMEVFKYTFIEDDSFPNIKAYDTWKNISGNKFESKSGTATSEKLYDHINGILTTNKDDMEDWYNTFRGTVLNTSSLTASEYREELFEKFRNGESKKSKEDIDYTMVHDSLTRFLKYDDTIRHIEKLKKDLEKQYKEIKNELKDLESGFETFTKDGSNAFVKNIQGLYSDNLSTAKSAYTGADQKDKDKIDNVAKLIINLKIDQIQNMCTIHTLAFSSKLDACKECYKQDKAILYKALSQTTKKIKESTDESLDETPEPVETIETESAVYVDIEKEWRN